MALGSYDRHKNGEVLSTESNKWSSIDPYPYDLELIILSDFFSNFDSMLIPVKASSYIAYAPVIYVDGAFYVIGGDGATDKNVIGRLDATTKTWSKSGELIDGRDGHNAIFDGSSILVVGGDYDRKTEKCSFSEGQIICTEQDPELVYYYLYPELFLIPANFCKTLI